MLREPPTSNANRRALSPLEVLLERPVPFQQVDPGTAGVHGLVRGVGVENPSLAFRSARLRLLVRTSAIRSRKRILVMQRC